MGITIDDSRREIVLDKRYHTCSRCKYGDNADEMYPCNVCIHSMDKREDMWELKEENNGR